MYLRAYIARNVYVCLTNPSKKAKSSTSENVESAGRRVVVVTFWKLSNKSLNRDVVGTVVAIDVASVDVVVVGVVVFIVVVVLTGFFVVSGPANNFC